MDPAGEVAEAIRLLYQRGLVSVAGGNVSFHSEEEGLVYITPTGLPRHRVTAGDVAVMTLDGRVVRGRPSSEWRLHVEVYRRLGGGGVRAVVHAHPRSVLAASSAGIELDVGMLNEAALRLGCVARVPRIKPGTWELARATASALESTGCRGAVLEGHGAVTVGSTVWEALDAMESLEDLAWMALHASRRSICL